MIVDKFLPPTHYWNRPLSPTGILIHFISAKYTKPESPYDPEAVYRIFLDYNVSAHYLVLRDRWIWKMVPEDKQAWHAGKSRFQGVNNLNHSWLGIEFVGDGEHDFTDFQYHEGSFLVRDLIHRHRIQTNRVKGHEQVSGPDVREDYKRDPGPLFDWLRFGAMVKIQAW